MASELVRIPTRFYFDHKYRDLDTPTAHRENRNHVWIDRADPALAELVDDARYYADPYGPGDSVPGIRSSAIATLKALGMR